MGSRVLSMRIFKPSHTIKLIHSTSIAWTSQMDEPQWLFFRKNWAANRPMSPWTVYKTQLPMATSLLHRITGVTAYGSLVIFALGVTALPQHFPYYIEWLQSWHFHPHLIASVKAVLIMPLTYHILNGMRHLTYDLGKGFSLPTTYATGYTVFALTFILSIIIALKL